MESDRTIVAQNEHITVWYRHRERLLHHQMHRFCFGPYLRQPLLDGVAAMKTHGGCKWLSDDRVNGAVPEEDEVWSREVFFPKTVEAGWKYWALLPPRTIIGQMNMRRFTSMFSGLGVTVQVFTSEEAAVKWLAAQPG
jgi:hypothetical protein